MRLYFDSHIHVHGKDKVIFIKVFLIRVEADLFLIQKTTLVMKTSIIMRFNSTYVPPSSIYEESYL